MGGSVQLEKPKWSYLSNYSLFNCLISSSVLRFLILLVYIFLNYQEENLPENHEECRIETQKLFAYTVLFLYNIYGKIIHAVRHVYSLDRGFKDLFYDR